MATSRKIALLFAAENVNAIIGWIALLFVARKMGASAIGEFSFALSIVGSFTFIAFFGFKMAHVKRISEGLDLGKCIGTFLSIRLFLISQYFLSFPDPPLRQRLIHNPIIRLSLPKIAFLKSLCLKN